MERRSLNIIVRPRLGIGIFFLILIGEILQLAFSVIGWETKSPAVGENEMVRKL